jgi:hypothetical protein
MSAAGTDTQNKETRINLLTDGPSPQKHVRPRPATAQDAMPLEREAARGHESDAEDVEDAADTATAANGTQQSKRRRLEGGPYD